MAMRFANYPPVIDSQGELTDPVSGTVAADTGVLTVAQGGGGIWEALVIASSSAPAKFTVQHRNAANGANVEDAQMFYTAANGTVGFPFRFKPVAGERIRVVMGADLTGTASVSVTAYRIS